jgi:cell division ATPase FtsA
MMNIVTRDIAEGLQISLEQAEQIQNCMECDGFDFSECSTRQLISTAKRITRDIAFFDECCLKAS